MTEYRFQSAPWIYTPNVLRYVRCAYKIGDKKDKAWAINVVAQWDAPEQVQMVVLTCSDTEFDAMVDDKAGTVTVTL